MGKIIAECLCYTPGRSEVNNQMMYLKVIPEQDKPNPKLVGGRSNKYEGVMKWRLKE
jgi:hypothetical protein